MAAWFQQAEGTATNAVVTWWDTVQTAAATTNLFLGASAGTANTTGTDNVFVGKLAGAANTTGANNTCVGYNAGTANTSGFSLTALGYNAAWANTTGESNTCIGTQAGAANTSSHFNVYLGSFAGFNETGQANCYVGYKAGYVSTVGTRNTYVGNSAAFEATAGYDNVFVGYNAGQSITTGYQNTFLGDTTIGDTAVNNAVAIGWSASATANGAIALGASATTTVANTAVIGTTSLLSLRVGGSGTRFDLGSPGATAVEIYAAGGAGTSGFAASSTSTADATDIAHLDFGTTGTAGSEKRAFAIHTFLVGSAATTITADAVFYTTNAGTIGEKARIKAAGQFLVAGATAIPAGGTTGLGLGFSSTANFGVFFGSGAPTLSAAKGSLYLRSDGSSTSTRAYLNTDGGTTWTALTTAA